MRCSWCKGTGKEPPTRRGKNVVCGLCNGLREGDSRAVSNTAAMRHAQKRIAVLDGEVIDLIDEMNYGDGQNGPAPGDERTREGGGILA